jgi:archaellum component FlaC
MIVGILNTRWKLNKLNKKTLLSSIIFTEDYHMPEDYTIDFNLNDLQKMNKSAIKSQEPILQEQAEKLARYKQRIKEANNKKMDSQLLNFKITSIKEQIDEQTEALHYAKQDLAAFEAKLDLSGNITRCKEAVEAIEKEIEDLKKELSNLERQK